MIKSSHVIADFHNIETRSDIMKNEILSNESFFNKV